MWVLFFSEEMLEVCLIFLFFFQMQLIKRAIFDSCQTIPTVHSSQFSQTTKYEINKEIIFFISYEVEKKRLMYINFFIFQLKQRRLYQQFHFLCVAVTAKSHSLKLMHEKEKDCTAVCTKVLQQRDNGQLETLGNTTGFVFISSNGQHSYSFFSQGIHCICCESS